MSQKLSQKNPQEIPRRCVQRGHSRIQVPSQLYLFKLCAPLFVHGTLYFVHSCIFIYFLIGCFSFGSRSSKAFPTWR